MISVAETGHEKRYLTLLENIRNGRVFKRETAIAWRCRNCGYLEDGSGAPDLCPACYHPQAYFEPLAENY